MLCILSDGICSYTSPVDPVVVLDLASVIGQHQRRFSGRPPREFHIPTVRAVLVSETCTLSS